MRLIGAVDPGEDVTAAEAADCFELLNELLESYSNENLLIFQILQESFNLTAGTASYTIGPTGVFVTTRPLKIISAFLTEGATSYPVKVITREEYDSILLKTIQSRPMYLYYEPSVPDGKIILYWVPQSTYTLFIDSEKQLQSFSTLTDLIVLPPGYKRFLRYNMAIEIAPEFLRVPSREVVSIAMESMRNIKRQNNRTRKLSLENIDFKRSVAADKASFLAGN